MSSGAMNPGESSAPPPVIISSTSNLRQDARDKKDVPLSEDEIKAHFNSLPASYRIALKSDKDIPLHQKLLAGARKPEDRPVFHVRLVGNNPVPETETTVDQERSTDRERYYVHEVTFSTINKPGLRSQLCDLLDDVGLHVRVVHFFPTIDDYCLCAFVVDNWPTEDAEDLSEALRKAIAISKGPKKISTVEWEWELDPDLITVGERVGSGSISHMHVGSYSAKTVALKIYRHDDNEAVAQFDQEVSILRKYQHQNIVQFIGACTVHPDFYIVTEHMPGGSLYEYLKKNPGVELTQLLKFAIDACKGMEYLHQNNIIHRDLKAANLLVGADNVVKVADFNISRSIPEEGTMTAETGTYRWMAPEVLSHQPYGLKADVYSFGVVLWELVTSEVPYREMSNLEVGIGVMKAGLRPETPQNINPKYSNLMQRCWAANPDGRPSFSEMRAELEQLLQEVEEIQNAEIAEIMALMASCG